jgi:hypothetical protein
MVMTVSGRCDEFYRLGYNGMQYIENQPTFQRNMLVDFQQTTWHYVPEDRFVHIFLSCIEMLSKHV